MADSVHSDQTASETNLSLHYSVRKLRIISAFIIYWTASSEFGTYRLCEQWRFRRDCSAQSHQNLPRSLIQAVSQEEPSDRKPDPWPLWMAGHAQLKFVMTECSKTQIRLTGLYWGSSVSSINFIWKYHEYTILFMYDSSNGILSHNKFR